MIFQSLVMILPVFFDFIIIIIMKDTSGPAADRLRKKIIKTFERLGLRITIEVNRKAVNYLDITMNLSDGTYRPYLKPNSTPIYINVKSNHPPQVLKNVPLGINRRLCSVSCNEQAFDDAKPVYQDALEASGHATTLQFAGTNGASATTGRSEKRKRGRKIIMVYTTFQPKRQNEHRQEVPRPDQEAFPPNIPPAQDLQQKHC